MLEDKQGFILQYFEKVKMKHFLTYFLVCSIASLHAPDRKKEISLSREKLDYINENYHYFDGGYTDDDISDNHEEAEIFGIVKKCEKKK